MYCPAWKRIPSAFVEPYPDALDGGCQCLDAAHHAVEVAYRQIFGVRVFLDLGLDHQVALRSGTARKTFALIALEVHQRKTRRLAMLDFTVADLHFAGRAQAMAAGMRQVDTRAQRCVENGLPILDLDGLAQRLYGQFMTHRPSPQAASRNVSSPGVRKRS